MKITVNLRERFGRDAEICFEDRDIIRQCSEPDRERLRRDLEDVLRTFGGLAVSIVEDRLATVPDRHRMLEGLMDTLEQFGDSKIREYEGTK